MPRTTIPVPLPILLSLGAFLGDLRTRRGFRLHLPEEMHRDCDTLHAAVQHLLATPDLVALWPDGSYCELDEIDKRIRHGSSDDFSLVDRTSIPEENESD